VCEAWGSGVDGTKSMRQKMVINLLVRTMYYIYCNRYQISEREMNKEKIRNQVYLEKT